MVSNVHYVAPHCVKNIQDSIEYLLRCLPYGKCFLSHHFYAELWHAHSEKEPYTSDLSAL
jgi:hypothetical protein